MLAACFVPLERWKFTYCLNCYVSGIPLSLSIAMQSLRHSYISQQTTISSNYPSVGNELDVKVGPEAWSAALPPLMDCLCRIRYSLASWTKHTLFITGK